MANAAIMGMAKKNKIHHHSGTGTPYTARSEWSSQDAPLLGTARSIDPLIQLGTARSIEPPLSRLSFHAMVPKAGPESDAMAAQEKMCELLQEWNKQQQVMHAEQQRLAERLVTAQRQALEEMRRLYGGGAPSPPTFSSFPSNGQEKEAPADVGADPESAVQVDECPVAKKIAEKMERFNHHDTLLDFWRRTHGLHTVDKWIMNYKAHPAGWGALLMIHGVPELTGRLRTKVENYAIYSALFLSMSIALLAAPADFLMDECEDGDYACGFAKRGFVYGLSIGTGVHMLCIMLAMSFVNALNETARDSDVYRLLAKGQGFVATLKCQNCFAIGCACDMFGVMLTLTFYLDWVEPMVLWALLIVVCGVVYQRTSSLLYSSCSITGYWREDTGGKPEPDDPYDLQFPVKCVHERAKMNNYVFRGASADLVSPRE